MNDLLKDFIEKNKEAFNSEEPGTSVFKKIRGQLAENSPKKKRSWRSFRWAAVVTAVVLVSVTSYFISGRNKKDVPGTATGQSASSSEEITTLDIGNPVYAKEIYYFRELIGLKQSELKQLKEEYPQLYQQFVGDINQLDSSYQDLKTRLAVNPNREMLLEAMIRNLQLQSELLNRQLMIIQEIKQKSKHYEKAI
ncbi:MAG: hypothetical protein ABIN52_00380 [Chitinophagaceae bacterium]